MLTLKTISLTHFKNYRHARFDFISRITGICGSNGVGKTNLLDAVYYLCFTRGYFSRSDTVHVHHQEQGFRIEGGFELNGNSEKVTCILRQSGKKEFLWNTEAYEKLSLHIGKLPCVMIAPDDVHLITGGSEERRRFMDTLLCQLDGTYLQYLMEYNRALQQRGSLLKAFAEKRSFDRHLLDVYDEQLSVRGSYVFEERKKFIALLLPLIKAFYLQIAGVDEQLELQYESQLLETPFDKLLEQYREKDLMLLRTTVGIHRDDLDIRQGAHLFRNIASQGQRKSLLFALKLAEFEILKKQKGFAPILLLDDVFEKLDASRMHNLLEWACLHNEGQIFVTDTHPSRITGQLEKLAVDHQLISL